ncbi:MAG: type II and III secretion system protein family protein [Hyphomicrobiaceae bacterium]
MQNFAKRAVCALSMALAICFSAPLSAQMTRQVDPSPDGSVLNISAKSTFPLTKKITLGVGRSMMVQFPMELRDVMIADPTKVDAIVQSSDRVFLVARGAGSTNAFFFDAQGNQVMTLEIAIGSDLSALDNLVKRLIPSSNVRTDLAGTAIVLMGSVRTPGDAAKAADIAAQFASANKNLTGTGWSSSSSTIGGVTTWNSTFNNGSDGKSDKKVINLLTIEGEDQVMLKVQVAEVQRSILKQFGVNFAANLSVGNFNLLPQTNNTMPITSSTLGSIGQAGSNIATAGNPCNISLPGVTNSGMSAHWSAGGNCIGATMRALERTGLVRTLAEPNLTAVSGETAKFLAGGEYPVPVSADNGTIGIQFKEFGVGVAFTPVVLSEGRISLKIDTQVSELTNEGALTLSGIQIPSLKKRAAMSTVELPSGGSIVMAGLISESTRQNVEGLPGAKDIPILGALFRSRDYQQSETELVIIVTPILVRPTAESKLAKPDDGLAPASDLKANFLGHLNRVYGKSRHMPDGGLKGDYGFIVD